MLNFFSSSKKVMITTLLVASSLFAQDACKPACEPCCVPHELLQCPTLGVYNAPARIDIQCGWDVWADASFTYWQAIQENMEPAMSHAPQVNRSAGNNQFGFVNLNFEYKPGFKVGLGMSFDYDNWDSSLEYTYYRGTIHRSAAMSLNGANNGDGYLPLWASGLNVNATTPTTAFNALWRLNMNLLDADLGRWMYAGTQLTFRPSIGARVAWITQNRKCTYSNILSPTSFIEYNEKTNSWGIGPRVSLDMNWLIGMGFRCFGKSEMDVLFTQYHSNSNTSNLLGGVTGLQTEVRQKDINRLRPHVDLELGMGWGKYLGCHDWHIDISASYGYQIFWNQNMFRWQSITNPPIRGKLPNGDLMIHGLTATIKLDF